MYSNNYNIQQSKGENMQDRIKKNRAYFVYYFIRRKMFFENSKYRRCEKVRTK